MKDEHRRLRSEAMRAEEEVEAAHAKLAEALARRSRVSKQLLFVEDKAATAIDREEESLEEFERLEQAERARAIVLGESVSAEVSLEPFQSFVPDPSDMPAIDWSFVDNGWSLLGPHRGRPYCRDVIVSTAGWPAEIERRWCKLLAPRCSIRSFELSPG